MKKFYIMGAVMLISAALLSGCGAKETPVETDPADKVYPFTIEGNEIIVGETTVGSLLDAGMKITFSTKEGQYDIAVHEVDPDEQLEANSYYSGGTLRSGDNIYGLISMVTVEAMPMRDAVIARLEVDTTYLEDPDITLAGVPLKELNNKNASEVIEGLEGDQYMLMHYGSNYEVFLGFTQEGNVNKAFIEKVYDIDWNSEN